MEIQKKEQELQFDERAQEQDGSLKNSDKHGHWYRTSQNDSGLEEDDTVKTKKEDAEQQNAGT